MSERGPFATEFDRWAAGYLSSTTAQVNLVIPPMRAAWQAQADLAAEREREIIKEMARRVFDRLTERIDQQPQDGISAEGRYSEVVHSGQRRFIAGMRAARLAALKAFDAALATHEHNEGES